MVGNPGIPVKLLSLEFFVFINHLKPEQTSGIDEISNLLLI